MLGGAACLWEENDVIDVQAFFACIEQLDRNNQFSLIRLDAEICQTFCRARHARRSPANDDDS